MIERLATLKAEIEADRQIIRRIYEELERQGNHITNPEQAIVMGYYLHNLYSVFEDIFERVAEVFENSVSDTARWHAQLLRLMTSNIEGVRPRLLSAEACECLGGLRRFRHVFRSLHAAGLDAERLALVLKRFITYLDRLQAQA